MAFAPASFVDDVKLRYFNVEEEGSDFVLTWEAEIEEGAKSYEVQRRTAFSNGQFVLVRDYEPKGVDTQYLFRDDQVFKSATSTEERVDYRLWVVYNSGAREILAEKSANYTSTALRRTWGSIKAMF